jgi:hypothetical protein
MPTRQQIIEEDMTVPIETESWSSKDYKGGKGEQLKAYSPSTDTTYESWPALVAAESNGYVVVIYGEDRPSAQWVTGPFRKQKDARRAKRRLLAQVKRRTPEHVVLHASIRIAWKDRT